MGIWDPEFSHLHVYALSRLWKKDLFWWCLTFSYIAESSTISTSQRSQACQLPYPRRLTIIKPDWERSIIFLLFIRVMKIWNTKGIRSKWFPRWVPWRPRLRVGCWHGTGRCSTNGITLHTHSCKTVCVSTYTWFSENFRGSYRAEHCPCWEDVLPAQVSQLNYPHQWKFAFSNILMWISVISA